MNNNPLLIATIVTLKHFDNLTLAAANNALTGFGRVNPKNKSYEQLLKFNLIDENGKPKDNETLLDALNFVINERVEKGEWN